MCEGCKGPFYRCDPEKNMECRKTHCGECKLTSKLQFALDKTPICPRSER